MTDLAFDFRRDQASRMFQAHRRALPKAVPLALLSLLACSSTSISSAGAPCGRNQHAFASGVMPDTGINAGREIQASFIQHDPDLAGELSEIAIQQTWPARVAADSEPDPRVRLLSASGQVFIDTLGTRFETNLPDGSIVQRGSCSIGFEMRNRATGSTTRSQPSRFGSSCGAREPRPLVVGSY